MTPGAQRAKRVIRRIGPARFKQAGSPQGLLPGGSERPIPRYDPLPRQIEDVFRKIDLRRAREQRQVDLERGPYA